ncbi:hypothetical protein [Flavobacterium sp.]|uniref:hypothetical protein n=1 Tax=Flavobacterium sp. TaxID=239 RepID=UPI0025E83BE2|nr:hypothetical protein [Flavobacterium sp.]
MELGFESENLFILAGLDFDTTEEREKYFSKSIGDLKLEIEKDDNRTLQKKL